MERYLLFLLALALPRHSTGGESDAVKMLDQRTSSRHFVFFHKPSDQKLAASLAQTADELRSKVLADLGTTGPDATRVYIASDPTEMRRLAPAGIEVPEWASAVALPHENLILIAVRSNFGAVVDLPQTLLHEWSHLALEQATRPVALPRWFREGFAIFESEEWTFARAATLARGVISGQLFSLEALTESFPDTAGDAELAYAQSIDFVGFLLKNFGRAPFHKLISLSSQGFPFLLGVEEAYDTSIRSLEDLWRSDLKLRFTWIPLITGAASFWILATLVFVLAYLKKRRERKRALERMVAEEEEDEFTPPPGDGTLQ